MKSKLIFKPTGNKFLQNKNIPEKAGIYLFFSRQGLIYVGQAGNVRLRVAQHMGNSGLTYPMVDSDEVFRVKVILTNKDLIEYEKKLITKYKPKYNLYPFYKRNIFNVEEALLNYQEVDW